MSMEFIIAAIAVSLGGSVLFTFGMDIVHHYKSARLGKTLLLIIVVYIISHGAAFFSGFVLGAGQ